ncbi:MAG: hypothetical protein AAGK32_18740 [Actinomycetota bacterium]
MEITTATSVIRTSAPAEPASAEHRLRLALRANAVFSVVTGAVALLAAPAVGGLLGVDAVWLIRLVGAGLLGFAAFVVWASQLDPARLRQEALQISIADLGWVGATIVALVAGTFSGSGPLVAALVGLAVLDLALAQLWFRHRTG